MAVLYIDDARPEAKQGMVALTLESGGEAHEFIMLRSTARLLAETIRCDLDAIERGEQAAMIYRFPPPELKPSAPKRGRR